jgi:uncharacterized protein
MLDLETRDGRVFIRLRVSPKSRKARVAGEHGGALKVHVTEPPEKGRANDGVIALLASTLGIAQREIELVSGHASHDKRVAISGLDESTLRLKLQEKP